MAKRGYGAVSLMAAAAAGLMLLALMANAARALRVKRGRADESDDSIRRWATNRRLSNVGRDQLRTRAADENDGVGRDQLRTRAADDNDDNAMRRARVRDAMVHAYHGYEKYAWGFDELAPVSKTGKNGFGGTGATIIDSLDTLWLMDLTEEFDRAREWVEKNLTFTGQVSTFETTIRVLGGLLSAYDLSGDRMFLEKARTLAGKMRPAFNTPTGMPLNNVNLLTGNANSRSSLAELGTEQLEWTALADRTGNKEYASLVRRSMATAVNRSVESGVALPPTYIEGLSPTPNPPFPARGRVTFGAMGDSFFEYLLKMYVQSNRAPKDEQFYEFWLASMDAMIDNLTGQTSPSGWTYVAEWNGRRVEKMDHLACFVPGMLALGLLTAPEGMGDPIDARREKYLSAAEGIAEFCYRMYETQPTSLAPEFVTVVDGHDMQAGAPYNILRPETVESLMLLWRLTKKEKYRDWGWSIFQAFERHCRTDAGYAGLKDVRRVPAPKDDTQQSFFLAETLKYLFLLFSPDDVVPLDAWVFNTEAHPLRRHAAAV